MKLTAILPTTLLFEMEKAHGSLDRAKLLKYHFSTIICFKYSSVWNSYYFYLKS